MATAIKRKRMSRSRKEIDTSEYSGRVAERFRFLLDSRKMDVAELQQRLKVAGESVPVPTLYNYLNGTRPIPLDLVPYLADALGVSVRVFFPSE